MGIREWVIYYTLHGNLKPYLTFFFPKQLVSSCKTHEQMRKSGRPKPYREDGCCGGQDKNPLFFISFGEGVAV